MMMEVLQQFGAVPIDYAVLKSVFKDYKFPKNKIAILEREGKIIRLKKGSYVVSPAVSNQVLLLELMANHLYGPSYVSMESALRYYGLIPETVYTVRSLTTHASKKFQNKIATFDYVSAPMAYYTIGITQMIVSEKYCFLIATPEKALCDLIITTPKLRLQSMKSALVYMEDDLRLDMEAFYKMDIELFKQCATVCKKKNEINLIIKLLER